MVVDVSGQTLFFFSEEVDAETLDAIMAEGQKTVIQELEMMAVLAALHSWRDLMKTRRTVLFTDSESVRGSFRKTWSANEDSDDMINIIFQLEEEFDVPLWIERVPSQSNPSDLLSRETVAECEGQHVRVHSLANLCDQLTDSLCCVGHKAKAIARWLRSSCTPNTLQRVLKSSNLFFDTFHSSKEKSELTKKPTCFASPHLDRQRKSSK